MPDKRPTYEEVGKEYYANKNEMLESGMDHGDAMQMSVELTNNRFGEEVMRHEESIHIVAIERDDGPNPN